MGNKKKDKKTAGKEETKRQDAHRHVRVETTVIVALVALVLGFFAGEIIDLSKPRAPMPSSPPPPSQEPPARQGPSLEQASRIFALENALSTNPEDQDSWKQLGHLYFDSNQFEEAIKAYRKALELDPKDADVWTDMGVMYRRAGQPAEAVAAFDRAVEVDPGHEVARLNKGVVLLHDLDNPPRAIEAWENLLKLNPAAKTPNGQSLREMVETLKGQSQQQNTSRETGKSS
jgi:cytochrome c-type biogenesis protein CcmH/NrfG